MPKVYLFLANGFEDIEALGALDILRRGGVEVNTVSISCLKAVESSHGVIVKADMFFDESDYEDADLLMLPGGMPGAENLNECEELCDLLVRHNAAGRHIAAICAAPMVLGSLGLLEGRRATCYPGFEDRMTGATYTGEPVTTDGNITTGEGPAATFPYAYRLLAMLTDEQTAHNVAKGMRYVR